MIAFSILTPALPSRMEQLEALCATIDSQIGQLPVEHLVLLDNKRRTVGEKRDALLRAARGKYVAFVDDDDLISDDYVALILQKIRLDPDVITFRQQATVNGSSAIIEFKLGNPNEPFPSPAELMSSALSTINSQPSTTSALSLTMGLARPGAIVRRNVWHVCAWRRSLAIMSHFPALNYGEDWAFAASLCRLAKTEEHIAKVLHFYFHSAETTQAPPPRARSPAILGV